MKKKYKKQDPKCKQKLHDCFACTSEGRCQILNNTEFTRKCPFYKSKIEIMTKEVK